jgi:hypothetical protein
MPWEIAWFGMTVFLLALLCLFQWFHGHEQSGFSFPHTSYLYFALCDLCPQMILKLERLKYDDMEITGKFAAGTRWYYEMSLICFHL